MATASKKNDEFFALAMVCSSILEEHEASKIGPSHLSKALWKVVYRPNGKDQFCTLYQKTAFGLPQQENSPVQAAAQNRAGCILQSTGHWALGLHSCRALSSQRQITIEHNNPKCKNNLSVSFSFEATYG